MTITSVKDLEQVTYEKKNGELIIHDGTEIIANDDATIFRGMMRTPLPFTPQSSHIKISFSDLLSQNFGKVYLARLYPNDEIEILHSAPLLVSFKVRHVNDEVIGWGFDIPDSVDLSSELKKRHANAVVWLPVIEVDGYREENEITNIEGKTVVKHGSFKLLKDATAKLNGYARPSSIKRTRKRQIEKARRMKHWCQEMLTPIKVGKTFGTIRRENGGIRVESKDC